MACVAATTKVLQAFQKPLPRGSRNRLIYIRGCQEHFSPSAGGAVLIRDIQPLVTTKDASLGSCPWVWVCVVPSHWFHFLVATTPISFETIKPCGCTVSTMDLSEARGLVLFRVIRGGIGITQRLGARHRLQAIVILTLEPERLKNRLATTRKNHRRWKGSSPETLKRLAILVFLRRSSLPSSTESVLWRQSCGLA